MAGFLLLLIAVLAVILYRGLTPQLPVEDPVEPLPTQGGTDLSGKWKEGVIEYCGKSYRYNTAMETYLFLGIDKEGELEAVADGIDGGQSDAIFLLAINHDSQDISVIGIHRNTMTQVDRYSQEGKYLETREMQLCLQHGYGDGAAISCARSVKAVSGLFRDIPIAGYLSLNMGGIRVLNDAVGGVFLEVMESISNDAVTLQRGEYVKLNGEEAYHYVRYRDTDTFDSASMRLERQMQYIVSLFSQVRTTMQGNAHKAVGMLEEAEGYICTNVSYNTLAERIADYQFDEADMYALKGRTVKGDQWEEFYVDENALQDLMIQVFYEEVE